MIIYLEHIEGSKKGQVESFDSERIRIGRQADNDLRFEPTVERQVSGHHAEIISQAGTFLIRDLQSKNGTYVNGHRITEPTPLADGGIIQFAPQGPKVVFLTRNPAAKTLQTTSGPAEGPGSDVKSTGKTEATAISKRTLVALMGVASVVLSGLVFAAWSSRWTLFAVLLIGVVVAVVGWLIWWLVPWRRESVASSAGTVGTVPTGPELRSSENDNLSALRKKWAEGLATLRKSKIGQHREDPTYAVPWLLVLGEQGSGKSHIIRAANPVSSLSSFGSGQGVSTTRNCDWWFFDNAVLLDTAGRYISPVPQQGDEQEWRELLSLMRRSRPQEPINGVVLAISADALTSRPPETSLADANQIRRRLDEMSSQFGTTFPVYLLVTKMDLIPGFSECFGSLPEAVRGQAMGAVNDDPEGQAGASAFLDRGFRAITDSLDRLRLARLDEEDRPDTLRALYLFPEEFRSLRGPLRAYTSALFRQNPYQETPVLRGLFFSSAKQGEPLRSRLAQSFGFPLVVPKPLGSPGAFFARDLFSMILSQDRRLAGRTAFWSQRSRRAQIAALVALVGMCLVLTGLFTLSFFRNWQAVARMDLEPCVTIPGSSADGALTARLKGLDDCRGAIEGVVPHSFWGRVASNFGLGQSRAIAEPLRQRYLQMFQKEVLGPLDARIDQKLVSGREAPLYVGAILQRIQLLGRCRSQAGCGALDGSPRLNARVVLTAEDPSLTEGDPRVGQFARTHEAFFRWQSDLRMIEDMHSKQVDRVMGWLKSGGLRAEWILASTRSQFPAVRSREFWGVDTATQVEPAYTRKAWTEGVEPLLSGLKIIGSDAPGVQESLVKFDADYRNEALRQWEQFLLHFQQGEKLSAERGAGREFTLGILGSDSPYRRVIDVAANNLSAMPGIAPQGRDLPPWVATLLRYMELKSTLAEKEKAPQESRESGKAQTPDRDPAAARYLRSYLEALNQLRGELSTPEKAYRAAQKTFEEGEPSETSGSLIHKAYWNRDRLKQVIGSSRGEDRVFWVIVGRPAEFAWRALLDQAGFYLQEQWGALRLEVMDLSPGSKASKILAFVNANAGPFLEARKNVYVPRSVQGEGLSFNRAFLDYLSRSRSVSPEELGRVDPPRQIVGAL
jgi:type VI secretion system protein ImpL